jgi:putative SOS response-associated peptidase YedK
MCGRYTLYGYQSQSQADPSWFAGLEGFAGNYNVAPTQMMPIARMTDGRPELVRARWGLIPKIVSKTINARCEGVATTSKAYRGLYFARRRCLVPARGFYEWKATADGKQAYYITSGDESVLAFAGLWSQLAGPDRAPLTTYTIITTASNDTIKPLHDRMPVILRPKDYEEWLTAEDPRALMTACHSETVYFYPVNKRVNSPKNNDAALVTMESAAAP